MTTYDILNGIDNKFFVSPNHDDNGVVVPTHDDPDDLLDYLNAFGEVRRHNITGRLDLNSFENRKTIISLFEKWVKHDEYIVLNRKETLPNLSGPSCYPTDIVIKNQTIVVKASKKGNDVYSRNLDNKMKIWQYNIERMILSSDYYTNALYVTLTYDPKIEPDIKTAWLNFGKEFNKFVSSLKKEYGDIEILRSWEAFRNGYPHCHAILVFTSHQFSYFDYENKDGIHSKRIDKPEKDKIASKWHSHVDVVAVGGSRYEIKRAVKDVLFYVQKSIVKRTIPTENPEKDTCRFCHNWPCSVFEDKDDYGKVIKTIPTTELDDTACPDFKDKRKIKKTRVHLDWEDSQRFVLLQYVAIEDENKEWVGEEDHDYKECEKWPYKRILTNAIIWYLGLRSYGVSSGISGNDGEEVEGLETDLRTAVSVIQTGQSTLEGNRAKVEYFFLGMIAGNKIGLDGERVKIYEGRPEWIKDCFIPKSFSHGSVCGLGQAFN